MPQKRPGGWGQENHSVYKALAFEVKEAVEVIKDVEVIKAVEVIIADGANEAAEVIRFT